MLLTTHMTIKRIIEDWRRSNASALILDLLQQKTSFFKELLNRFHHPGILSNLTTMSLQDKLEFVPLTGHCVCKTITYTLTAPPMVTHCCHCTYCQQETGSAFALNAVIECYNLTFTSSAEPLFARRPSPSSPDGNTHLVACCPNPNCNVDVFAYYGGNKTTVYLKAGTLDNGSRGRLRPDVHIFTSTKAEWVDLRHEEERGVPVFKEFYDREDVWSKENLERLEKLRTWAMQQKALNITA